MLKPTKTYHIHLTRGDTLSFGIKLQGLGQDLDSAYFTCKTKIPNVVSTQVFQKSLNNGITKVGDGEYTVRVAPADTADLNIDTYAYDLQIGVNSDVFTLTKGNLYIEEEVTQ